MQLFKGVVRFVFQPLRVVFGGVKQELRKSWWDFLTAATLGLLICECSLSGAYGSQPVQNCYLGMCDASAGVVVDQGFLLVASDEDDILRLYDLNRPLSLPVRCFDLTTQIAADPAHPEADLEAVSWLGDRLVWVGSHGRNKDGKIRPSRHCFFATELKRSNDVLSLEVVGQVRHDMLSSLRLSNQLADFSIDRPLPPKEGGLNIEAMAADKSGGLWIGFRSPILQGKALAVHLLNPNEVLFGDKPFAFDLVKRLDLGGLGFRDLVHLGEDRFLLLAGPAQGQGRFAIFLWEPAQDRVRRLGVDPYWPSDFTPEALVLLSVEEGSSKADLLVLSDDGERRLNGGRCKDLPKESLKCFRILRCRILF